MDDGDLERFMAEEGLPDSFRRTAELVCEPLAARAQRRRIDRKRCAVIGLCGAQGSGKSTVAAYVVRLLEARGLRAVAPSLDDFYMTHEARQRLAREVHPLLATRGPPGTHDVGMASAAIDQLRSKGKAVLPRFDKAADTRAPRAAWPTVATPVDVILLEGWCVGAVAQGAAALATPVNALERDEDAAGVWRTYVNDQLDGPYQELFGKLHDLILLAAPSFEVVAGWRAEQEAKLRAKDAGGMSEAEIARFVAHYERLTRWILAEMPARAAWTVSLDANRSPFE
ncbi:kinase [Phenylobacterium sp.]|uniref:kinase n=1 Tax=Phenylobacterium sp. TaxID=1871053 RepID=UPI001201793F|nr:kinase [Phenylobacterium sp.]THD62977.1 MAG: kinase [Phenylobacterium sp.]